MTADSLRAKVLGTTLAVATSLWVTVAALAQVLPPPAAASKPAPAPARPPPTAPLLPPHAAAPRPEREQMKAKVREQIRAVRAQKLDEIVKPDPATAARLQDIVGAAEDQLTAVRKEAQATRRDLTQLLKTNPKDIQRLTQLTDQLLRQRQRLQQIENDRTAAMRKVLTPEQYARIILAWRKVNREIQEQIYKAVFKSRGDKPVPQDDSEY